MADDQHRRNTQLMISTLVMALVLVGVFVTVTLIISSRQDIAIDNARHAEYRICVRQMVTRAAIRNEDDVPLPIYDCTPNLHGKRAVRLDSFQTLVFVEWVHTTPISQLP